MSADIDIVARLRILWTSCTDRINNERTEAADEIERLRRDYSAAEQDHVDCAAAYHNLRVEIERLRNERDQLAARCGDHGPGAHTAGPVETFIPEAL